ncbi:PhzF family phenazine biosynthesis protein [Sphingomonas sp. 2378]|uniref:PhzF family phenazine biosynthesis protein n=1 Tax=Sphingomonas sp. 2378 TaxID=1219748 RepID=UPI00311B2381
MTRPFSLVDVFGTDPLTGNPLAVIADAEGLSSEDMQRMANWLDFAETTFLLPPNDMGADYRVRIFTRERELPFAGHPTLGSAHAWLEAGGQPKQDGMVVQQCGVGLVTIRRDGDRLSFAAPPLLRGGTPDEADLIRAADLLQIDRQAIVDANWADNGPSWLAVMLESADAVLAVEPACPPGSERLNVGVVGPHRSDSDVAFEIRAIISPGQGSLLEDPVTGSLNASVGQWLFASGRASDSYVAAQGTRLGRSGRIHVSRDDSGQVWVAGATRTLFSGRTHG